MSPQNKLLIVEGREDQHVIWQIQNHLQIRDSFTVAPKGGFDEVKAWLIDVLPQLVKTSVPHEQSIGILIDADSNALTQWQSVVDRLRNVGYQNLPTQPQIDGLIIAQQYMPKLGVWMMPNNYDPGILEDFIASLVPKDDPLWPKAVACVNSIAVDLRRFKPDYTPKAYIHTWLAWQEVPGTSLGLAITREQIDVQSPHLLKFIGWLRQLFDV